MTAPQPPVQSSRVIRIIHAALVTGVVLFLLVTHFGVRPAPAASEPFAPVNVVALAIIVLGIASMLRRRIPKRAGDESPDAYWMRATAPAIVSWTPLELGSLLAIAAYSQTGSMLALMMGAFGAATLAAVNPGSLERR